jgi:KipI family sensor histidine kinase inhibitor
MKVVPFGDSALLVEVDGLAEVLALTAAMRDGRPESVLDVVPAARTVLVIAEPGVSLDQLVAWVTTLSPTTLSDPGQGECVEIDVVYDGPDLAEVGDLTGLGADGVVEAHTGTAWTVAFAGFAPGFAYLCGGDPRIVVPRRDEPRTSVPAGSVGLAGEYSGVYPRSSPGGWQLIGRTDAPLWDVERESPALLVPGGSVRFRAVHQRGGGAL